MPTPRLHTSYTRDIHALAVPVGCLEDNDGPWAHRYAGGPKATNTEGRFENCCSWRSPNLPSPVSALCLGTALVGMPTGSTPKDSSHGGPRTHTDENLGGGGESILRVLLGRHDDVIA